MGLIQRTYSSFPTPRIEKVSMNGYVYDYGTVNVERYSDQGATVILLAEETELDNDLPEGWVEE